MFAKKSFWMLLAVMILSILGFVDIISTTLTSGLVLLILIASLFFPDKPRCKKRANEDAIALQQSPMLKIFKHTWPALLGVIFSLLGLFHVLDSGICISITAALLILSPRLSASSNNDGDEDEDGDDAETEAVHADIRAKEQSVSRFTGAIIVVLLGIFAVYSHFFPLAAPTTSPALNKITAFSASYDEEPIALSELYIGNLLAYVELAQPTRTWSVNDRPDQRPYLEVVVETNDSAYTYCIYTKGDVTYLEIPYEGVYLLNRDFLMPEEIVS